MGAKTKEAPQNQPYTAQLLNPSPLFSPTATPSINCYYSKLMGEGALRL